MMYTFESCVFLMFNVYTCLNNAAIAEDQIPLLTKAPQWLNACRRNSSDLDECVRDTFQHMFPFLAQGIPEIGMDAFEPMHIDYVGIKKGQGPVTLAGSFKNLIIYGPSNTTAVYTKFNLKQNKLDIGLFIPTIKVDATYDLKGKLLLLPLVGVGHAKLHLKNVSTNVATEVYFPKMLGEEVMVASSMKVDFSLTHMRVYLDNLFNGNKVLGRSVNQFLNQNALLVVDELKETIGENLAVVFKKVMNDAFSHIPTKLWLMNDTQAANYDTKAAAEKAKAEEKSTENKQTTEKSTDKQNIDENRKTDASSAKLSEIPKSTTRTTPTTTEKTLQKTTPKKQIETTTKSSGTKVTRTKPTTEKTSNASLSTSTTSKTVTNESEYSENTDDLLEETEESRVDREESQNARSENNNQLDQLQSESNNRIRTILTTLNNIERKSPK